MGLDAIWQQIAITSYQLWVWFRYETGIHPFLAVGAVVVFVLAWAMYKTEVRGR